jgi:hypothetical protein
MRWQRGTPRIYAAVEATPPDATLQFLSCEPLLTPLPGLSLDGIGWVIGGEQSGQGAVCGDPAWMRDLRDLYVANAVPFFLKQWVLTQPTRRRLSKSLIPMQKAGRRWREDSGASSRPHDAQTAHASPMQPGPTPRSTLQARYVVVLLSCRSCLRIPTSRL